MAAEKHALSMGKSTYPCGVVLHCRHPPEERHAREACENITEARTEVKGLLSSYTATLSDDNRPCAITSDVVYE